MASLTKLLPTLFVFCMLMPSFCFAYDFQEVSIVFNPKVQFEFSDRGVQERFYREGNSPFNAFKAVGRLKGRVFTGMGVGKIEDGRKDYGCRVELTLDESMSEIETFKIEVNTREVLNRERNDVTSVEYFIKGKAMPLSHISNYSDHDTLTFALKGPLAKKTINNLQVTYKTSTHQQVAKESWKPVQYWRRSVDFKFGHSSGVFIFLKGKAGASLTCDTVPVKVYDIEKSVNGRPEEPALKCVLSMVDRKVLDSGPSSLVLKFRARSSVVSSLYGEETRVADIVIHPLSKPKWYVWKSDMVLEFKIPLYEVLRQMHVDEGIYESLVEMQFNPGNPKDIPEETVLTLNLGLKEASYRSAKKKTSRKINFGKELSFEKRFILGPEIDLAKATRLKAGKAHSMDWHDVSGVVLFAAQSMTGLDLLKNAYSITDCIIQAHGGYTAWQGGSVEGVAESGGSVAGAVAGFDDSLADVSGKLGLLFLIPQLKRLVYDEFWGTPALIRKVEEGMKTLNYVPLSEARATKNFPIWFNREEQKLALIDPAGLVHPVKPPENFHISWGFFQLQETEPAGKSLLFKRFTESGWTPWWTLGGPLVKNHKILPPLRRYVPLRMKLPTPSGYTGKQRQVGFGAVRSVTFSHSKNSKLVLERGEDYDGVVDFGWEDVSNPLVYEKPYLTLVSGRLRVKDEASRIGIGFYTWKGDVLEEYRPRLWCEPQGTEYVIDYNPETETCSVDVIEGAVIVRNDQGEVIDDLPEESAKMYHVPMDWPSQERIEAERVQTEKIETTPDAFKHQGEKTSKKKDKSPSQHAAPSVAEKMTNYLGLVLPAASERLVVVNALPESPARKAGFQMGDAILAMNGEDMSNLSPKSFVQRVIQADPAERLAFTIKRGGRIMTLLVDLERVPRQELLDLRARQKKKAQGLFAQAQAEKKQGHYEPAASLYARAASLDPRRRAAYDYQAYCLDKLGRREQGYRLLEISLLLQDTMYNNYLYGKFLSSDEQYRQAIPYLERACERVKLNGRFFFPFRELGGARFMLNEYREASEALLTAERMGDSKPLTIGTLGVCFDKLGNRKRAVHYYRQYLAMDDSNPEMRRMARSRLARLEKTSSHRNNKDVENALSTLFKSMAKEMQK